MIVRRTAAALSATAARSLSGVAMAAPAQAAPVVTGGLVNVTVVDFADVNIEDVIVQVPVAVAATVCDVNVNVLARQLRNGGAACTASNVLRVPATTG